MKEFLENIHCIYEPFENGIYKFDKKIDEIKFVIYVCNSMIDNIKYRGKYFLMKGFKANISEIVSVPAINNKEKYETLVLSRFLHKYQEEILNFSNVIEKRFSKDDLTMFHKNIKTLNMKVIDNMKMNGYYEPYQNYIVVKKEKYLKTLPHELFHVTTSRVSGNDSICGFHYLSKGLSIGMAINEGYTDIMANRYFNSDISCSFYAREIKYYDVLEEVLGTETIEKLYMNANLVGFIKELSNYKDEKEVINFIVKTDDILRNERNTKYDKGTYNQVKKHDITNKIIDVNMFLASICFKKNGEYDLTNKVSNYDAYSKLYMINENNIFKNIYIESLTLYNLKKKSKVIGFSKLEELYEIIGYDKLEDVCFNRGIRVIINELIKYTSLDEIYMYLNYLDKYTDSLLPFDHDIYNIVDEFNFSLMVSKSSILDDVQASVNAGFNANKLFYIYRNIVRKCLKENKDIFGDNNYFDYNDASRLYELVGKENMLRLYITGDIEGFKNALKEYADSEKIMHLIDANSEELKDFLDKLNIFENSKHM